MHQETYYSTMTSKGQITIPAQFRQEMDLKPRDKIEFIKVGDGFTASKKRKVTFEDLYSCLPKPKVHFTLEELKQFRGRRA